jgi:hypothetical protein
MYLTTEQKASAVQQYPLESRHTDLVRSLQKSFTNASAEHFRSSSIGVYPTDNDSSIALVLVANKYSPQNFWNGRWRSAYILNTATNALSGTIKADVHYYEDGNVRMATSKKVDMSSSGSAEAIVRDIVKAENKFQEELNRAFVALAEGSFKGLRRQLPVTRQRVEWEKIGGYRVSSFDIGVMHREKWLTGEHSWDKTLEAAARNDSAPRTLYNFDHLVCNSAGIPVCHGTRMTHVSYVAMMSFGICRVGME